MEPEDGTEPQSGGCTCGVNSRFEQRRVASCGRAKKWFLVMEAIPSEDAVEVVVGTRI